MCIQKEYDNIKISIVIPVYNTEKYISRCIESIVGQELNNYEIIVIDDCSTDHSYKILKNWEKNFSQIKLFQNARNMGAGFTKNEGLNHCTGKYMCFVDSDDWIKKGSLKKLLELAERTECDAIYYEEESRKEEQTDTIYYDIVKKLIIVSEYVNGIEFLEKMLDEKKLTVSANHYFIRRDAIDKSVSFSENRIIDDLIFTVSFLCSIKKVVVLENDLYVYYKRTSGNITGRAKEISMIKEMFDYALHIWKNLENINEDTNRVREKCVLHMMSQIHNDYFQQKSNGEIEYLEISRQISDYPELKTLFEKSKYLSVYGAICNNTIKKLKKAKNIYIYGTGNYGIDTFRVLYMNNIPINGFIETHKKKNMNLNFPVYSLDEFSKKEYEITIVIAVSNQYRNEIIALLKENNFTNYFSILERQ